MFVSSSVVCLLLIWELRLLLLPAISPLSRRVHRAGFQWTLSQWKNELIRTCDLFLWDLLIGFLEFDVYEEDFSPSTWSMHTLLQVSWVSCPTQRSSGETPSSSLPGASWEFCSCPRNRVITVLCLDSCLQSFSRLYLLSELEPASVHPLRLVASHCFQPTTDPATLHTNKKLLLLCPFLALGPPRAFLPLSTVAFSKGTL